MNKKIIYRNGLGTLCSCVFSPDLSDQEQWERVLDVKKGCGFSVELSGDKVRLVDYFHGETRAEFAILAVEETDEEVSYVQKAAE